MNEVKDIIPENVISCNEVKDNKIYIAIGDGLSYYMLTQRHTGELHSYSWRSMVRCRTDSNCRSSISTIKSSIEECVVEAIAANFMVMEFDNTKEMAIWLVNYFK